MDKCKGIFGFLFGHSIKEAVDVEEKGIAEGHLRYAYPELIEAIKLKDRKVVAVYCKRCGQTIKREALNEQSV